MVIANLFGVCYIGINQSLEEISMRLLYTILLLTAMFLICLFIASWFVKDEALMIIEAILILISFIGWSSLANKKR